MDFLNQIKGWFKLGRGDHQRKNNKSVISSRLNLLITVVGILLLVLGGRLFYLQVLNGNAYKAEVKRSDTTIQTNNVQRGMIYDSQGRVMVGNQAHQAITYTKGSNVSSAQLYKVANRLGRYVDVSKNRLTDRNKIDYYLANDAHLKRVEKMAHAGNDSVTSNAAYNKSVTYLENHPDKYSLTADQKNKAKIYAAMSGAYSLSTTYIKETGVTSKELAEVGEHLNQIPGVKIGKAWTRNYPQGTDTQSLTGTVSTTKTGLPDDEVNRLLSQGYSRNDSVGRSYLEKQYQSTLAGSKSQTEVTTTGNNVTKSVTKYAGKKGDNLVLTINSKFQQRVQDILKNNYAAAGNAYSTGVYAVVMNPHTGAIYAMAGIDRDPETGKETVDQVGAINHPIVLGSVVKGATVMGGLMSGVITPTNNTLTDHPITLAGTQKSSWFNHSGGANMAVDAPTALEVSSNSYMMQLAMKEAGFNYKEGENLTMSTKAFTKLRYYFNMFGLGTKTGIDLPGETTGFTGPSNKAHIGSALDLSYGNYDAYTVIQLAQYMSTIANGGYKMRPYLVKEVRGTKANGQLGRVESTTQPQVQAKIPATKEDFKLVHEGLYLVTHGTNAYVTAGKMKDIKPSVSGKTGTAETYYKSHSTTTLSFAGYAPSNDPQVVVALSIPGSSNSDGGANMTMARQIFNAYWKMVQSPKKYENSSN